MEPLYQYAWLVPVLPLVGATLVGAGLISFNEVTNRLRQVNAVLIISTLGASMVLSFATVESNQWTRSLYPNDRLGIGG
jgi:NAD(P)H-quinone oxidoreductase subunit 5